MTGLRKELERWRDGMARFYRDGDLAANPDGYMVAPYVNSEVTPDAFKAGFNALMEPMLKLVESGSRLLERIVVNDGLGEYKGGPPFVIEPFRKALADFKETIKKGRMG